MLRPILAATDLSPPARHAVDRAFRLAGETGQPLQLIHAIAPGLFDELQALFGSATGIDDRLAAEALDRMQQLAEDYGAGGAAASCAILHGQPLDVIARHADEQDARLLVLGARGEDFLRHLTLGTTASRLLRKLRQPVLVVRQAAHEGYRRALVAMDFSPVAISALRLLRELAPHAEPVLLHAVDLPFEGKMLHAGVDPELIRQYRLRAQLEGMQRLRELARQENLPEETTRLLAINGRPAEVLLAQEQEEDCDLIVVGKRGQHRVEELLMGSTTIHLLAESQADILIAT